MDGGGLLDSFERRTRMGRSYSFSNPLYPDHTIPYLNGLEGSPQFGAEVVIANAL